MPRDHFPQLSPQCAQAAWYLYIKVTHCLLHLSGIPSDGRWPETAVRRRGFRLPMAQMCETPLGVADGEREAAESPSLGGEVGGLFLAREGEDDG